MVSFEKIAKLYSELEEELEGVENYSEEYLKNSDDSSVQRLYSEMAKQELQHAQNIQKIMSVYLDKMRASENPAAFVNDICDYFNHKAEKEIAKTKAMMPIGI